MGRITGYSILAHISNNIAETAIKKGVSSFGH